MRHSELVGNRLDLALLLNDRGLTQEAVEVGTDRGLFARAFLERWKGEFLYCVDDWQSYAEMPWKREGDFLFAVAQLAPHAARCRIVQLDSKQAARVLPSVGFVYIDAAHDYASVTADIANWWPKIKPGGVLAGHDIDLPGVRQAVDEFAARERRAVEQTSDYYSPSWFTFKP